MRGESVVNIKISPELYNRPALVVTGIVSDRLLLFMILIDIEIIDTV